MIAGPDSCGTPHIGCEMDCCPNARIGSAAAGIAGHRGVDIGITRFRRLSEQRGGGHDLARLTVAALRDVDLRPRLLQGM